VSALRGFEDLSQLGQHGDDQPLWRWRRPAWLRLALGCAGGPMSAWQIGSASTTLASIQTGWLALPAPVPSAAAAGANYVSQLKSDSARRGLLACNGSCCYRSILKRLGSFSARLEIGNLFGAIDNDSYKQLSTLREMRNACAHSKHRISFQGEDLRNVALRLFGTHS
jgi:hypothetical protein